MPNSSTSRFTRFLCSLACALAFCFSSLRTYADEFEDVVPVLSVGQLDEDQFRALAALAPVALGSSASGNITNDVAAILALLQSVSSTYAGSRLLFNTISRWDTAGGYLFPQALARLMSDEDWSNNTIPSRSSSFLYQIQRALYGQSGVPSASNAIQPILLRMLSTMSAQSNAWTTNDVEELLLRAYNVDNASWGLLDEYQLGSHSDAWDVWLEDSQLAALLSAVGGVSNSVDNLAGLLSGGTVTVGVDLSPVTDRQDRWQDYADDVDDAEAYQYAAFQNTATSRDQQDADLIDDTVDEFEHTYSASPPSMDTYTTASTTEAQDVDKDSLLDALDGDVEHPSRWVLLSSSDAQGATGNSFEMVVSFNEGRLGTFIADATTIMRAGWYGLLAAMSALLFWRKQTEISAIVHGTNFSRV